MMTMFSSDVLTSPLEHGRQPDDKTKEHKSLRMFTSHYIRKEVSWNPLVSLPMKLGWNQMSTQSTIEMVLLSVSSQVFSLSIDLSSVSLSTTHAPLCGGNGRVLLPRCPSYPENPHDWKNGTAGPVFLFRLGRRLPTRTLSTVHFFALLSIGED